MLDKGNRYALKGHLTAIGIPKSFFNDKKNLFSRKWRCSDERLESWVKYAKMIEGCMFHAGIPSTWKHGAVEKRGN
jgi:hypothetical protein